MWIAFCVAASPNYCKNLGGLDAHPLIYRTRNAVRGSRVLLRHKLVASQKHALLPPCTVILVHCGR